MNQERIFLGQLLVRVIVGCVDHDAFNGLYAKNPFNFKNYKITKLAFQVDAQYQPVKPNSCNFDDNVIAEAYLSMFTGTRKSIQGQRHRRVERRLRKWVHSVLLRSHARPGRIGSL